MPIQTVLAPPSMLARYTCASILAAIFAVWGKFTFIDEEQVPGGKTELHSWRVPFVATGCYLISLVVLRMFSKHFLQHNVDTKVLLRESMVLYNAGQVFLNGWMVYRILHALIFRGHPFIGGPIRLVDTGASYAVWVHYCDKYLEFLDTYFMVIRGKMDQVRGRFVRSVLPNTDFILTTNVRSFRCLFSTCTTTLQSRGLGGSRSSSTPGAMCTLAPC